MHSPKSWDQHFRPDLTTSGDKWQPPMLKNEVNTKLQFLSRPLEAGSKIESILIDSHVEIYNFTGETVFLQLAIKTFFCLYDSSEHLDVNF